MVRGSEGLSGIGDSGVISGALMEQSRAGTNGVLWIISRLSMRTSHCWTSG